MFVRFFGQFFLTKLKPLPRYNLRGGFAMNREILDEKVYYYTDVFEDLENLIQEIDSIPGWGEWAACSGEHYVYGTDKTIIASADVLVDNASINSKIYGVLDSAFQDAARDYAESQGDTSDPKLFPAMPVKKYMAGTSMGTHYDQQEGDDRLKYSLVMYLNDDYEGGEISFTIRNLDDSNDNATPNSDFSQAPKDSYTFAIKPKAGSIVIFPSSPPYHHTAHLVKSGFKYMVPQHWTH
jgi:hypothetical protein